MMEVTEDAPGIGRPKPKFQASASSRPKPRSIPLPDERVVTPRRIADALVENLGDMDGGWAMFLAGLSMIRVGVDRAIDAEHPFGAFPDNVFSKLMRAIDDGLRLASLGCELEELRRYDEGREADRYGVRRRQMIADVLHRRAVETAEEKLRRVHG